uniref:DNA pilot protein n=1 Tax=Microviridae sp. ctE3S2 TaxID=2824989 RepID=A0A8S5V8E3_9VIRU|nr:MAG TPA: hypothetical protein [Microviridae sp. ctE3S2]
MKLMMYKKQLMKILSVLVLALVALLIDDFYGCSCNLAIFGMIGNIFGSSMSARSQRKANEMNLKINQMNNEFNAKEAEKARAFQFDMWNKENAYNTPAAQRERMAQAGYNAYMNPADAGSASGMSSTTAASAASPAVMQATDFSSLGEIGVNLAQELKTFSEKKGLDIRNFSLKDYMQAQIDKMKGQTNWRNLSPEAIRYNLLHGLEAAKIGMESLKEQWTNQKWSNNLLRANVANSLLDAEGKIIINKYLDQQQQADLNIKSAHYEELILRGQLHVREARESLSREILNYARANGQKISNRIAERTANNLIYATNAANYYEGTYNMYRARTVKQDAASDYMGNQWQNQLTGELLNAKRWDNEMQAWREAINSANSLLRGSSDAMSTYNTYKNGRYERNRPYTSDYEEYEQFDKARGTRRRTRKYIR